MKKLITKIQIQIKKILRNRTLVKLCLVILPVILILVFLYPHIALGADPAAAATIDKTRDEIIKDIQAKFGVFLQAVSAVLWPILMLIGGLFDNELIFGGQMGETLLSIWVQVRNLVNIVFVLVLIVIAIYNVLGLGETGPFQQLQLRQIMPKFVIGLIVVNFSFLAARVVLDFTNVLTTAAFSLPVAIDDQTFAPTRDLIESDICFGEDSPLYASYCNPGEKKFNEKAKDYFKQYDQKNVALVMAIAFGRLSKQQYVKEGIENIARLTFNTIFSIVIYIIYALSFIALFLVLIVRIGFLWVLVALSPLIALGIVFPNLANLGTVDPKKDFVKYAIVPIKIGFFMSIGYLMFNAMATTPGIQGGYFSSIKLDEIDINTVPTGLNDLQQFLVAVATAAIVWIGVFSAAKDTLAGAITEKIKGYAQTGGQWLATAPFKYGQFIPIKGFEGKFSLAQMIATAGRLKGRYEDERSKPLLGADPNIEKLKRLHGEDFMKELAYEPGILKDSEGLRLARERLKERPFEVDIGDTPQKAAETLSRNPKFANYRGQLGDEATLKQKIQDYQPKFTWGAFGQKEKAETLEEQNARAKTDITSGQFEKVAVDQKYLSLNKTQFDALKKDLDEIKEHTAKIKLLREGDNNMIDYDTIKEQQIELAKLLNRPDQYNAEKHGALMAKVNLYNAELVTAVKTKLEGTAQPPPK